MSLDLGEVGEIFRVKIHFSVLPSLPCGHTIRLFADAFGNDTYRLRILPCLASAELEMGLFTNVFSLSVLVNSLITP